MEERSGYALEVVAGPAEGEHIAPGSEAVELGRHSEGSGKLGDDPMLSRVHARLRRLGDGRLLLEDLGSSGGTFVNDTRIGAPTILSLGDEIGLGASKLTVVAGREAAARPAAPPRRPALRVVSGFAPGALIYLGEEAVTVGGKATGERALGSDPAVADEHLRVTTTGDGRLLVEDLGSEGGTYVGETRIAAPTLVSPGERLRVGSTTLEVVEAVARAEGMSGVSRALGGVRQLPEGLFTRIGARAPVTFQDLVPVFCVAVGWALASNFLVRSLAIEVAGVSEDLHSLQLEQILPATFFPVLGNSFGFFMSFRRPNERSVVGYMIPSIGLPLVFVVLGLVRLEEWGIAEVVTTLALVLLPAAITVFLMFRLRRRVARERIGALRAG